MSGRTPSPTTTCNEATVARDGKVRCRDCRAALGSVWKEQDCPTDEPWWAERPDGEMAGFGPESTRREAVALLTSMHGFGAL